jgi:uncharacterized protein (DUF1697 family)
MPPRARTPARSSPTTTWLALLRGINVGGHNKVPMADLRALFEELGHSAVSTYIASGNVLFSSPKTEPQLLAQIEPALAARFKLPIRLVLRSAAELQAAVAKHPFPAADPSRVFVYFCAAVPKAPLDPARSPGDSIKSQGRHLYLHCPGGAADTKFTIDYVERTTATHATARNWRTATTLASRAAALALS